MRDDESLKNGVVVCKKCNSEIDFKPRKDRLAWVCRENHRHWQPFREFHSFLPLMHNKLPAHLRTFKNQEPTPGLPEPLEPLKGLSQIEDFSALITLGGKITKFGCPLRIEKTQTGLFTVFIEQTPFFKNILCRDQPYQTALEKAKDAF